MLGSYRKGAAAVATAAAFACATFAVQADGEIISTNGNNHTVLIVDGGYFPAVTFVKPGDHIKFENQSANDHVITGPEESWTSGPISHDSFFMLDVTEATPLVYSGLGVDGVEVTGALSFDPPPLEE